MRKIALIAILALEVAIILIMLKNTPQTANLKPEIVKKETIELVELKYPDMARKYILEEVKKSGIDSEKVFKLISCESQFREDATNVNPNGFGTDRGLYQISDKYHPEVSDEEAYDYKLATGHFIRILKQRGWEEWQCGRILNLK